MGNPAPIVLLFKYNYLLLHSEKWPLPYTGSLYGEHFI